MEVPTDKRRETWDKWQTRKQFLVLVITTHIYPIMLIIEMYVVALNYVLLREFEGAFGCPPFFSCRGLSSPSAPHPPEKIPPPLKKGPVSALNSIEFYHS